MQISFTIPGAPKGKARARTKITEWLTVETWERQAEACNEALHKGSKVFVEGTLESRTYDKKDGGQGFSLEIKNARVVFLDKREATGNTESAEDLPFD